IRRAAIRCLCKPAALEESLLRNLRNLFGETACCATGIAAEDTYPYRAINVLFEQGRATRRISQCNVGHHFCRSRSEADKVSFGATSGLVFSDYSAKTHSGTGILRDRFTGIGYLLKFL